MVKIIIRMIISDRIVLLQQKRLLLAQYDSFRCWLVLPVVRDCHCHQYQYQYQYQYQQCQKIQQQQQQHQRCLSSSSRSSSFTGSSTIKITTDNKKITVWERQAIAIKDIDNTRSRTTTPGTTSKQQQSENKYIETLREIHDPTLHVKTIEDELIGTIGKALGKQGEKIIMLLKLMKEEHTKYNTILNKIQSLGNDNKNQVHVHTSTSTSTINANNYNGQLKECIKKYNQYRIDAIQARWELIVHRQAAGFITMNHQYIMKHYPIADTILEIPQWSQKVIDEQQNDYNENVMNSSSTEQGNKTTTTTTITTKKIWTDQFDWWDKIGRWK